MRAVHPRSESVFSSLRELLNTALGRQLPPARRRLLTVITSGMLIALGLGLWHLLGAETAGRVLLVGASVVLSGTPVRMTRSDDRGVFRFAGVRPLPASAAAVTGRIPRDHYCELIEGEPPVLCMIGGKWTTFRSFGALAADTVMERLGVNIRDANANTKNIAAVMVTAELPPFATPGAPIYTVSRDAVSL